MSIEKYVITYVYGFGFGKYNGDRDDFVDECEIHCDNDIASVLAKMIKNVINDIN